MTNKVINDQQSMVECNVDYMNLSHGEPKVLDDIVDILNKIFCSDTELVLHCIKVHEYLGIKLDFLEGVEAKFHMKD